MVAADVGDKQVNIRIGGYPALLHEYDMDELDASINFRLAIIESLKGKSRRDKPISAEVEMFETFDAARAQFLAGSLDAIFCSTSEYFDLEDQTDKDHLFTMSWDGQPTLTYSLVTTRRTAKTVKTLSDLQGKVLFISMDPAVASRLLTSQLKKEGFGGGEFELEGVVRVKDNQTAIINLMFGKTDAVLVPTIALKRASRGNPQVQQKLATVFESDEVVPGVVALRKGLEPDLLQLADNRFLNLHTNKAGRKMLELFQAKRMVKIDSAALESARALLVD